MHVKVQVLLSAVLAIALAAPILFATVELPAQNASLLDLQSSQPNQFTRQGLAERDTAETNAMDATVEDLVGTSQKTPAPAAQVARSVKEEAAELSQAQVNETQQQGAVEQDEAPQTIASTPPDPTQPLLLFATSFAIGIAAYGLAKKLRP
ncbi:MAG: hypothetical protein HY619_02585 [Thaumarchaeota archaeon]|nr:hypothetical protein [Nitrososphaerota archaeon]